MNPEIVKPDSSDYRDETERPELLGTSDTDSQLLLPPKASSTSSNTQWQQYGERVAAFLQELPGYVTRFFQENSGPLVTIALVVGVFVAVKLLLALLDAVDDIPLIAPTLELIGISYTFWFVYRYLLYAANRQELAEEVKSIKDQVLGSKS